MTRAAFSTLGLPAASIEAVVATATDHGFGGVELRVGPDEAVHAGMSGQQRNEARRALERAGVVPLCVASYVKVVDENLDDETLLGDATAHLRLAHDLGAGRLRVFPGGPTDRAITRDDDLRAGRRLAAVAARAEPLGVTVAIETHDSHGAGSRVRDLLDHEGCGGVAAIWDVLHTWLAGEPAAESREVLGDRLAYVQIKDVPDRTDLTPVPPGEGSLPLDEVETALRNAAYDGWVSWEYERAWHLERPPLDAAATRVRRLIESWC